MKNAQPRGKTPSLIGHSNGRPKRVEVKKRCKCNRCGCSIEAGQDCFGIPRQGSGFSVLKRYCKLWFNNILKQTHDDLKQAENL